MTLEEAHDELRAIALQLKLEAISLEAWADRVSEIITEACPGEASPRRAPGDAPRVLSLASRMSTEASTRSPEADRSRWSRRVPEDVPA